jgi:hypothetical protein
MLLHHQHKDIMILQNNANYSITQQHIPDDIQFHVHMFRMYTSTYTTYLVCPHITNTDTHSMVTTEL